MATDGLFTNSNVTDEGQFLWVDPIGFYDAQAGRFCSASNIWFPGSMIQWIDGEPFGNIFAPQSRVELDIDLGLGEEG